LKYNRFEVPALAWFGQKMLGLEFPEDWLIEFYPMKGYMKPRISDDEIKKVIRVPIGCKPLSRLAEGKRDVVVVVDDMTRPTRAYQIVPHVMEELKKAGVPDDGIRFIMGGGTHGAWYRYDFAKKIGEDFVAKYPVYNHSPFNNCVKVGETKMGTPVEINAEYNSCDLKIGIGLIVPHPMVGYGGGAKIILPGIASYQMIYHNHVVVHRQNPPMDTYMGYFRDNVTRADIDEAGKIAGMDLKIDVLVNGIGESTDVFAGDLQQEFLEGVKLAKTHYLTPEVPEDVDVIVANTYAKANEATIALGTWKHRIRKKDGVMVIIAQAPEGQTTHYLYGKFGKLQFAPGNNFPCDVQFRKVIVYSEYPTPDPFLPFSRCETLWLKSWREVIEELKSSFDHAPKVAVIPNAEIQCPAEYLSRP
jgi:nickel-dependent lactate racemase